MTEWATRRERQASRAEYERVMQAVSPEPNGAYIESGVLNFVFGELWRRGVLAQTGAGSPDLRRSGRRARTVRAASTPP